MPLVNRLDNNDRLLATFWIDENLNATPVFEAYTGSNTPKRGFVPPPPNSLDQHVLLTGGWGWGATANTVLSWNGSKAPVLLSVGGANGLATLDSGGKIPIGQIPDKAIEVTVTVANQTARFALTTAQVQNGDRVKQTSDTTFWEVVDETNLGNANGYVQIDPIDWTHIANKPDELFVQRINFGSLPLAAGTHSLAFTGALAIVYANVNEGAEINLTKATVKDGDSLFFCVDLTEGGGFTVSVNGGSVASFDDVAGTTLMFSYRYSDLNGWFPAGTIYSTNTGNTLFGPNFISGDLVLSDVSFMLQGTSLASLKTALGFGAANGFASLDANGKLNVNQIPDKAIETTVTVANQAARFALTTTQVQNGDRVKQTSDTTFWEVVDDTNLGNANGYVQIDPIDWSHISNKPTTLTGYGITDAVPNTRTVSAAGLATGGGALSANVTITVPIADATETARGSTGSKAVVPSNLQLRLQAGGGLLIGAPDSTVVGNHSIDVQATRTGFGQGAIGVYSVNVGSEATCPLGQTTNVGAGGLAQGLNTSSFGYKGIVVGAEGASFGSFGYAETRCTNVGHGGRAQGSVAVNVGHTGFAASQATNVGAFGQATGFTSCNFGYSGNAATGDAVNVGANGFAYAAAVNVGAYGYADNQGTNIGATGHAEIFCVSVGHGAFAGGNSCSAFGYGSNAASVFATTVGAKTVNSREYSSQLAAISSSFGYGAAVRVHGNTGETAFTLAFDDNSAFSYSSISDCPAGYLGPQMARIRITSTNEIIFEVNVAGVVKSTPLGTVV